MITKLIKLSFFILSVAFTIVYINNNIKEIKNTIGVEINITNMSKIEEVFSDLKFLKFHNAVQTIEYIEQQNVQDKTYDIYEITEEAKVLGGWYNFNTKNKISVSKVNKHNFFTNVKMKLLGFFTFEFNTEFIAFFNENKTSIIFEERNILKGPSLFADLVSSIRENFHIKMIENIKKHIEDN